MQRSDLFNESALLQSWADESTRQLDLVASWENLLDTYDTLRFCDPISDDVRLEEFKWIIREMNKFLTRARKSLMSCKDLNAAWDFLMKSFTPTGTVNLENRKSLAYHKLRQQWILMSTNQINAMKMDMIEKMEEESDGYDE